MGERRGVRSERTIIVTIGMKKMVDWTIIFIFGNMKIRWDFVSFVYRKHCDVHWSHCCHWVMPYELLSQREYTNSQSTPITQSVNQRSPHKRHIRPMEGKSLPPTCPNGQESKGQLETIINHLSNGIFFMGPWVARAITNSLSYKIFMRIFYLSNVKYKNTPSTPSREALKSRT